jgi:putative ABC transport system ATP-binding protein
LQDACILLFGERNFEYLYKDNRCIPAGEKTDDIPLQKDLAAEVRVEVLETKNLRKVYQLGSHAVKALDGVDFLVKKGEFVAIMGPSGSGKSTLLHLIGGLDQPTDGEVTLAGKPLSLLKDKEITLLRRHNVGFVFQFFNLLPTLTTEENITLPLIIDGKNPRQYQERLDNLLNLVGLSERRSHKPDQLSGGEQQRVSLARALITEPEILLADEPTGNLDSKTGISIMELLRLSRDELGQTIVVVTHDARAAAYADRVVFLRDGKIATYKEIDPDASVQENLKSIMAEIENLET